jgi:hypothetical protein
MSKTLRNEGDAFVFYNGGMVIIDWINETQIGYRIFYPGEDEPRFIRKDFDIFERSLNRDHCIYEGQMA